MNEINELIKRYFNSIRYFHIFYFMFFQFFTLSIKQLRNIRLMQQNMFSNMLKTQKYYEFKDQNN
jgi:hypothetical protein